MAEDLTYTEPFAPRLEEIMPEIGIDVVDEIRFPVDTSDFSPHYSQAQNSGADAIVPIQSVVGPTPIVQWWDQQIELPLFGVLGQARDDGFYNEVDGKVLSGTANLQGAAADITENTMDFVSAFEESFGHGPVGVAYTSYDGLMSLFAAVENVGSVDDTDELIAEMESITYTGVSGVMDYQGQDDEYPHDPFYGIEDGLSHTYVQWQEDGSEGSKAILFPEAWADSDGEQELILPPWME